MCATWRSYQILTSWSRRVLRRRRQRSAEQSRRFPRGMLETLKNRLLLSGGPLWPAAAPDRFEQALEALLPGTAATPPLPAAPIAAFGGQTPGTSAADSRPAAVSHTVVASAPAADIRQSAVWNGESEISDFKSEISNGKSEISNLKSPIPNFKSQISNSKSPIRTAGTDHRSHS